jgi:eight-cysteine-cluster-containing protein
MHISQHIIFFGLIGVIILGGLGAAIARIGQESTVTQPGHTIPVTEDTTVTDFDTCAAAGNPVMESYPRQCRHTDGRTFTEVIVSPSLPEDRIPPKTSGACAPAGCSSQLCVPKEEAPNIMTTCEWTPLYGCYQKAICEQQDDGTCGWTETDAFTACVENIAE